MAVIDADRHHQDLVDELIAAVEAYNPGVDKDLLARAFPQDRPSQGLLVASREPAVLEDVEALALEIGRASCRERV